MIRQAWKPITAALVVGTPAYLYYRSRSEQQTFDLAIRVKGPDGKPEMSTRTLSLLSLSNIESRIQENATIRTHPQAGGPVWSYATASLASNDPIEDAHCDQIIQRDQSDPSAPGDYLFFAVMDGHGGHHTSRLLSRVLVNAVALELSSLVANPQSVTKPGLLDNIKSSLWSSPSQATRAALDSDPQRVSRAIEDAFTKLDAELLNTPIRILANSVDEESRKNKVVPDLSKHPLALSTMLPAISGSCALMAVFDTAHRNLYIACTGDSRAVAGTWEKTAGGKGHWKVDVLSEDQTGRNPSELRRVQSEHPKDEAEYVIHGGRILGGLEPSRAFGDARYKWPRAIQEMLNDAFLVGNGKPMRQPPSLFKTPPYVIARPVVTHRKLSFSAPAEGSTEKAIHFLVLATDGLWDQLSSEDVVSLVGGHLSGLKGNVAKSDLPSLVPISSGSPTVEGKDKKKKAKNESWAFKDENVSAHLIRNAFGGGDEHSLREILSIPAPYSRRYRDDVTVTVVWWEDGNEDSPMVTSITEKIKSKL